MKLTKAFLLVFLVSVLFPKNIWAVTISNIRIVTPSPTPVRTLSPVATPKETITLSPAETVMPTATETPTEVVTQAVSTIPTIVEEKTEAKDNLAIWFLAVTIGLLLIIIVAQAWPKSDDEIEK